MNDYSKPWPFVVPGLAKDLPADSMLLARMTKKKKKIKKKNYFFLKFKCFLPPSFVLIAVVLIRDYLLDTSYEQGRLCA